jgi:flagellar basal body rod protein FlgB
MLKKSVVFGLLATGLMITPTAAFAGEQSQSQTNVQVSEQDSTVINGSTSVQNSNAVNIQQQIQKILSNCLPYYYSYITPNNLASQNSDQSTNQSSSVIESSVNTQDSNTVNYQHQVTEVNSYSY